MKKIISIIVICGIIYFLYPKNEPVKKVNFIPFKEFGIITHEDIYTDTIDLRLYTRYGRLKKEYYDK
jgi:hypothetical protein